MSSDPIPNSPQLKPFDVVALLQDVPAERLVRGQVGTVVERFPDGALEVEFNDPAGRPLAVVALRTEQVIRLVYDRQKVA